MDDKMGLPDALARLSMMKAVERWVRDQERPLEEGLKSTLLEMHKAAGVRQLEAKVGDVRTGLLYLTESKGTPAGREPAIVNEVELAKWLVGTSEGHHAVQSALCDPKCREELLRVAVKATPEHLPAGVRELETPAVEGKVSACFRLDRKNLDEVVGLAGANAERAIERAVAGELPGPTYETE